jgi:hypothetical protein
MEDGTPISYMALEVGTPVLNEDGFQFGTVERVLQIPEEDVFDGISVTTEQGVRFVDRDQITLITTRQVRCSLSEEQVDSLPEPHGTRIIHPDYQVPKKSTFLSRLKAVFNSPKEQ